MALCKKEFEAETIAEAQNSADLTGEGDRALGRIADVFDSVRRIKIMPEVITFVGDNDECVLLAAKHGEFLTCHAGRFTLTSQLTTAIALISLVALVSWRLAKAEMSTHQATARLSFTQTCQFARACVRSLLLILART
jgi:hypothetical protein